MPAVRIVVCTKSLLHAIPSEVIGGMARRTVEQQHANSSAFSLPLTLPSVASLLPPLWLFLSLCLSS